MIQAVRDAVKRRHWRAFWLAALALSIAGAVRLDGVAGGVAGFAAIGAAAAWLWLDRTSAPGYVRRHHAAAAQGWASAAFMLAAIAIGLALIV